MNLEPYDKTPTQNRCGIWAVLVLVVLIVAAGLALMGCSTYREHITTTTDTVITETTITATVLGTGNRRDILGRDGISSMHSQIPETITAAGDAAGKAARAAAGVP